MIRSQRVHPPSKSMVALGLAPLLVILISVGSMAMDPEAPTRNLRVILEISVFFSHHGELLTPSPTNSPF